MAIELQLNQKQGHWILARVGKRVLRPGGRELTRVLIDNMDIGTADDVVEFAPGLGFTASLTCARKPSSYTGVDNNQEAAALAARNIRYDRVKMIVADAAETTLPDACATRVYGEAMLTMQSLEHKKAIIREAARLLRPGGYYGIHEMGLKPDNISEAIKQSVYKEISANIRVPARPLTTAEWVALMEGEGFEVVSVHHNPMHLLEPKRVIQDEGFFRTLKIVYNVLTHADLRQRIKTMRRTFKKHESNINAIAIVARKV
ncbi:MAG: class I SAM-dependent methyltransferase [Candidatus Pseudobacter hemicellulosilyticus]|uniref:Class I SAM-dependent methyltransferase n=1 Tax=Candidatus Pseudobacter hemicellulosilyticus TaxID=3121375 RepID=A0AAJ5WZB2_9BACT|nr:MAG: class I SAM-dependent methyltransferase [Pseudobacter sp.]